MGCVHHSNYALYMEEARMALFSSHGLDVAALEKEGVILPLVRMEIRYLMPIRFGDKLSVETILNTEKKFKLELDYKIFNQNQKLLAKASTALVFVDRESGRFIPGFHKYLEPLRVQEIRS